MSYCCSSEYIYIRYQPYLDVCICLQLTKLQRVYRRGFQATIILHSVLHKSCSNNTLYEQLKEVLPVGYWTILEEINVKPEKGVIETTLFYVIRNTNLSSR